MVGRSAPPRDRRGSAGDSGITVTYRKAQGLLHRIL